MAENPRIDVELKERQSTDIARPSLRGFVEIGILSDAADTTGLERVPFAKDQLVLITASTISPTIGEVRFSGYPAGAIHDLSAGALQEHIESQASRLDGRLKKSGRGFPLARLKSQPYGGYRLQGLQSFRRPPNVSKDAANRDCCDLRLPEPKKSYVAVRSREELTAAAGIPRRPSGRRQSYQTLVV